MPSYRIKLANGKSLVLRGDEPPTDADIEAAATQAGVRALLMSSDTGEAPATGLSDSPPATTVAALSALASGGMAAAPAVVGAARALAPRAVPLATGAVVARDLGRGDIAAAAEHGVLGTAAASTVGKVVDKIAPFIGQNSLVMRLATLARRSSPFMLAASGIMAAGEALGQQERTLTPQDQAALRWALDRDRR
jgi:hypothetical protein